MDTPLPEVSGGDYSLPPLQNLTLALPVMMSTGTSTFSRSFLISHRRPRLG